MSHRFKTTRARAAYAWKRQDRTEALLRKTSAMIRTQEELEKILSQFAAEQDTERRLASQRALFIRMKPYLPFDADTPRFFRSVYIP